MGPNLTSRPPWGGVPGWCSTGGVLGLGAWKWAPLPAFSFSGGGMGSMSSVEAFSILLLAMKAGGISSALVRRDARRAWAAVADARLGSGESTIHWRKSGRP